MLGEVGGSVLRCLFCRNVTVFFTENLDYWYYLVNRVKIVTITDKLKPSV